MKTSAPSQPVSPVGVLSESPESHACLARLKSEGFRQLVTYQPAGRFWALQWLETALLSVLALLLAGFSFWRIRRDLA